MSKGSKSHALKLLITGGTFDKEYDEISGRLYFRNTHVDEMLKLGRALVDVETEILMMVDSLEMKDSDREKILKRCLACDESKIVITHGTDTMEVTAQVLGRALASRSSQKTIVLTGAMVPYKFGSSDGLFNLGAALAFAQTLPPGVFVAMNGRALEWNRVTKNKKTGEFTYKESKRAAQKHEA